MAVLTMISGWKWLARWFIRLNVLICVLPVLACADIFVILCQGLGASTKCSRRIAWLFVTATCFYCSLYILGWSTTYLTEQNCSESTFMSLPCTFISLYANCIDGCHSLCRIVKDLFIIGAYLLSAGLLNPQGTLYAFMLFTSALLA